jgi:hypothetical protein
MLAGLIHQVHIMWSSPQSSPTKITGSPLSPGRLRPWPEPEHIRRRPNGSVLELGTTSHQHYKRPHQTGRGTISLGEIDEHSRDEQVLTDQRLTDQNPANGAHPVTGPPINPH